MSRLSFSIEVYILCNTLIVIILHCFVRTLLKIVSGQKAVLKGSADAVALHEVSLAARKPIDLGSTS